MHNLLNKLNVMVDLLVRSIGEGKFRVRKVQQLRIGIKVSIRVRVLEKEVQNLCRLQLELDCKLAGYICLLHFHREIDQSIHQPVISLSLSTHPIAPFLISLLNSILACHHLHHHGTNPAKERLETTHSYPIRSLPHGCDLELGSIYVSIKT